MSKIAEIKAFDRYPKDRKGCLYDMARNEYIKGYDQAMQDFLGWLKDCSTFTYSNGYKRIDDDLYNKLVEDFKNYMQDEI